VISIDKRREASRLRLSEFYEQRFLRVFHVDADQETVRQYRLMFRPWAVGTGDPAIGDVTSEILGLYVCWRLGKEKPPPPAAGVQRTLFDAAPIAADRAAWPPVAPATVNKERRQVLHLLSKAGPVGPRARDALGIIAAVPWVRPLKESKLRPRVTGDDELSRIYLACGEEELPRLEGVRAPDWWRALLVAVLATDYRREALFGLQWCDVDFAAMTIANPAANDKEDQERCKPMSPLLAAHLVKIRGLSSKPFCWPHGERTWYERWHAIQTRAGIHARPKANHGEHYTFHEQKGSGLSRLAAIASPAVVQFMGDHACAETARHYVDLAQRPEVRQAVDTLRLPAVFYEGFALAAKAGA
jgi:hypothetical protein